MGPWFRVLEVATDRLVGFDDKQKERIKAIAPKLVEGQIESGLIDCTDEAINDAVPQAVADAKAVVAAAAEFLCG